MIFRSKRKYNENDKLRISLNRNEIEQVDTFKYLGIHLDSFLTFDCHIDALSSKVKQRTRLLWKMRSFIPQELALELYGSLIEPLFIYCCHLYDGCSRYNRNRLQVLQNNALRAVMMVNSRFSATDLHNTLSVDWLDVYRQRYTCIEVYKLVNGIGPPALTSQFEQTVPARVLRSNESILLYHVPTKTVFAENDFVYRGKVIWSKIPADIQHAPSIDHFKAELKKNTHLFEHIT